MSERGTLVTRGHTRRIGRGFRLATALVLALSCVPGDAGTLLAPVANPLDLAVVQVTPEAVTLPSGGSYQFTALAILPDSVAIVPDVIWTATGGTITASGLFTAGTTPGTYQISAQIRGRNRTGTAPVQVAPSLTSLVLNPAAVTLAEDATQQFAVAGTWSDGSATVPSVTYTVTGGTVTASGLYTAGTTPGNFTVIATQQGGTKADTAIVTIAAPAVVLLQMILAPASLALAPGGTGQFAVAGTWSDGSSSAPAVTYSATGGTITAGGLYTAGATTGTFRVIARQMGGTKVDTSAVTISAMPPTLTQMVMSPAVANLASGGTAQFSVMGTWSDGSKSVPAVTYSATGGTITVGGLYMAGATIGVFRIIATQQGGTKADTSAVTVTAPAILPDSGLLPLQLTVRDVILGNAIPEDFIGLSYEKPDITRAGMFATTNGKLLNLLRNLGPGVLRFGGGSLETTGWSSVPRTPTTPSEVLTPSDYTSLVAFAKAVNWKLIVGLNLGRFDPTTAATEASYLAGSAQNSLLAVEVGNEVNEYPIQGLRPASYSYSDFKTEFEIYASQIGSVAPGIVYSGPATADAATITPWVAPFLRDESSRVAFASYHLYPLGPTSKEPASSPRYATIPNLLSPTMMQSVAAELARLKQAANAQGKPFRVTETNSAYGGGQAGVSDVYAAALWGADFLFTLAESGAAGANFHVGYSAPYAPIQTASWVARPLYYGMLFFTQAARGNLVPASFSSGQTVNVSAYALTPASGQLNVVLINKEPSRAVRVAIQTAKPYSQGSSLRLLGPSLSATDGLTIGGTSISASGSWSPSFAADISIVGLTASVDVPAASAVFVRLIGAKP